MFELLFLTAFGRDWSRCCLVSCDIDFHFRKSFRFLSSMITKRPRTRWEIFVGSLKKNIKTIVIIEGVAVVGSYLFWRRMNHSQDFRYYLYLHYPTILECYYSVGETASGNKQLREFDYTTWTQHSDEQ